MDVDVNKETLTDISKQKDIKDIASMRELDKVSSETDVIFEFLGGDSSSSPAARNTEGIRQNQGTKNATNTSDENDSDILIFLEDIEPNNNTGKIGLTSTSDTSGSAGNIFDILLLGLGKEDALVRADNGKSEEDEKYKDAKTIEILKTDTDDFIVLLLGANNDKTLDTDFIDNVDTNEIDLEEDSSNDKNVMEYPLIDIRSLDETDETDPNESTILNILLEEPSNDTPRIDNSINIQDIKKEIMDGISTEPLLTKGNKVDEIMMFTKITNSAVGSGKGNEEDENYKDPKNIYIPSRRIDTDIILLLGKFSEEDTELDNVGNVSLTEVNLDNDNGIPDVREVSTSLRNFGIGSNINETNDNPISLIEILLGNSNSHSKENINRVKEVVGIMIKTNSSAIDDGKGSEEDESYKDAMNIQASNKSIDPDIILLLATLNEKDKNISYNGNVNLTESNADEHVVEIPFMTEMSTGLPRFDTDSILKDQNINGISLLNILLEDSNTHSRGDNNTNRTNNAKEIVGGDNTERFLMQVIHNCRSIMTDLMHNKSTTKNEMSKKDKKVKDNKNIENDQQMVSKGYRNNSQIDSNIYLLLGDSVLLKDLPLQKVKPIKIGDVPYDVLLILEDNAEPNSSIVDKNVNGGSGHIELKEKSYPYYPNMYYPP
jgi:hypothetical protein